jgi:hypothetical protein
MAQVKQATDAAIGHFLEQLGLAANPIEKIIRHKDGSATIWATGLAEPVELPAVDPSPPKPRYAAASLSHKGRGDKNPKQGEP